MVVGVEVEIVVVIFVVAIFVVAFSMLVVALKPLATVVGIAVPVVGCPPGGSH